MYLMHILRIDINGCDLHTLKHECEFYGVQPLIRRLQLCEDLEHSQCGDVLFNGYIDPPHNNSNGTNSSVESSSSQILPTALPMLVCQPSTNSQSGVPVRPGAALRLNHMMQQTVYRSASQIADSPSISRGHSRASSTDSILWTANHLSSMNISSMRQKPISVMEQSSSSPASVILLAGHQTWISVAYSNNGNRKINSIVV